MTPQQIKSAIRQACEARQVCEVRLQGEPAARRIHPHGVAHTARLEEVIVAVQVGGYSKTANALPGFRNLALARVQHVQLHTRTFKPDPDFNPLGHQYHDWVFHI